MQKCFTKILLARNLNLLYIFYITLSPLDRQESLFFKLLGTSSNVEIMIIIRIIENNYFIALVNRFTFKRHVRGHVGPPTSFRNLFSEVPDR